MDLRDLNVPMLKAQLLARGLDGIGNKAVLMVRLTQALDKEGVNIGHFVSQLLGASVSTSGGGADASRVRGDPISTPAGPAMVRPEDVVHGSNPSRGLMSVAPGQVRSASLSAEPVDAQSAEVAGREDVGPHDSVSQAGARGSVTSKMSRGSSNSVDSLKSKESARRAGLKVRMQYLKERQKLEIREQELRMKKEELELEAKMVESEAREAALMAAGSGNVVFDHAEATVVDSKGPLKVPGIMNVKEMSREQHNQTVTEQPTMMQVVDQRRLQSSPGSDVNDVFRVPQETEVGAARGVASTTSNDLQTSLLSKLLSSSILPKPDIPVFSGDYTRFPQFLRAFEGRVAGIVSDEDEKLRYLEQFTSGTPRELVRGCMFMKTGGYDEATKLLKKRYGNPEKMSESFIDKLLSWQPVKAEDVHGLDRLSVELRTCLNAVDSLSGASNELNHPKTMKKILDKLPFAIQERWRRAVDKLADQDGRTAMFSDLVNLIEIEARVASNTAYGRQVFGKREAARPEKRQEAKTRCNYAASRETEARQEACLMCKRNHSLDECPAFMQKSLSDRETFIRLQKLCFGCLRTGHRSKWCRARLTCAVCGKGHPSALHRFQATTADRDGRSVRPASGETPQATLNVVSTRSDGEGVAMKMPIVPVKVKYRNGPSVEIYAFLDSGSSSTFCSRSLLNKLEVTAPTKTRLSVTTMAKEPIQIWTTAVEGLTVSDIDENDIVHLPVVFSLDEIPASRDEVCHMDDLTDWPYLQDVVPDSIDAEVGLLIGVNVPEAFEPIDFIPSCDGGPFAVKTRLGWVVNGPVQSRRLTEVKATANRIRLEMQLNQDEGLAADERGWSVEDHRWMEEVEAGCIMKDGHYEIPIPLKKKGTMLPDNREVCTRRLQGLKRRFRDESFSDRYREVITGMSKNGFVERVKEEDLARDDGLVNYMPHHGVFGKKDKLRVVFDCSSIFKGVSLNDAVLQGPSLCTPLIDVLIRFRQEEVAFMGDVNAMFHQVSVPADQRDLLRFLWWQNGDPAEDVEVWRMTVHPFGLRSSPSCASYALLRTAVDFGDLYSTAAGETISSNIYVDDLVKSVANVDEAVALVRETRDLCSRGGFHLAKFVSNKREVLESIPSEDRGNQVKELNFEKDLPSEKTLGVQWRVESDEIGFSVSQDKSKPCSRRGMLSVIGSLYDPLGMAAPFVVRGRILLQELTRRRYGWDDLASDDIRSQWEQWICGISLLSTIGVPRCVQPVGFGPVQTRELHHFSDASSVAYGTVSYLRIVSCDGRVHCAFIFGKARVLPLNGKLTIPRAELTAATLAARVEATLRRALQVRIDESVFWTDSTTVLRYIQNETTRFHTFVTNRLAVIRDVSSPAQWRYVDSASNPADDASRGQAADNFIANPRWFHAPAFLWKGRDEWPESPPGFDGRLEADPEVKKIVSVAVVQPGGDPLERLFSHYSVWYRLVRAVAWIIRLKHCLLVRCRKMLGSGSVPEIQKRLAVQELQSAEKAIVASIQRSEFAADLASLEENGAVRITSSLARLDPYLHDGMIKIGGRLRHAPLQQDQLQPPVLPRRHHVVDLIIQSIHEEAGHSGREHVLSLLRSRFWILRGNSAVRRVLSRCVSCRRRQGPFVSQKMADLPEDRVTPGEPPFTNTGLDMFGVFYVKKGRKQEKRYGIVFSCLASRAVHIEVVESMSTDSFICALRRFLARRGQVKTIRSDRGTNFVGASNELSAEWEQLSKNEGVIHESMLQRKIDWIFNVPEASTHGGVWERVIRTIRKVLDALLTEQVFTEETLTTLLCEVESIVNSRPLTYVSSDSGDLQPLTPNHLLLAGGSLSIPIGVFGTGDLYLKRRWRQAQYLADLFWSRWVREYIPLLQQRQKALRSARSLMVGDVVLMADRELPRCRWPLGRVVETMPGKDGLVRSVKLRVRGAEMFRPVNKLVLLCENQYCEN